MNQNSSLRHTTPQPSPLFGLAAALCLLYGLLHLVAAWKPGTDTTWGVAVWGEFPAWADPLWLALLGLGVYPPTNRAIVAGLEAVQSLFDSAGHALGPFRRPAREVMALALSIGAVFFFEDLKCRYAYGDGILGIQDSNHAPMSAAIYQAALWIQPGRPDPTRTIRWISALSGGVFVFFALRFTRLFPARGAVRPLVFLLLLTVGSIQIFFGYLEVYFIPAAFMMATLYLTLRYLRGRGGLLAPSITYMAGYVSHLSLAWFAPAMVALWLVALHRRWMTGRMRGVLGLLPRLLAVALASSLFVALTFGTLWQTKFKGDWQVFRKAYPQAGFEILRGKVPNARVHLGFVPKKVPKKPGLRGSTYARYSPAHLLEVANEQLLTTGMLLPVMLLFAAARTRPRDWRNPKLGLPAVFAACGLAFALLWYPVWGMPRDWDLFSVVAFPVAVLGAMLIAAKARDRRERDAMLCLLVLTHLAHTVPWVMMNHLRL